MPELRSNDGLGAGVVFVGDGTGSVQVDVIVYPGNNAWGVRLWPPLMKLRGVSIELLPLFTLETRSVFSSIPEGRLIVWLSIVHCSTRVNSITNTKVFAV